MKTSEAKIHGQAARGVEKTFEDRLSHIWCQVAGMLDIFRNGACRFDANGNIPGGITQLPVTYLMVGTAVVYMDTIF
jgi:hypothetical protein